MVDGFESNKTPQGLPFFLVFPHKALGVPGEQFLHVVFVNALLHIDQVGGNGISGDSIGEDAEEGGQDYPSPACLGLSTRPVYLPQ